MLQVNQSKQDTSKINPAYQLLPEAYNESKRSLPLNRRTTTQHFRKEIHNPSQPL